MTWTNRITAILSLSAILGLAPAGYSEEPGHPPSPPAPPAASIEATPVDPISNARDLIDTDKPGEAIPLLVDYLKGKPEDVEGRFLLGSAYLLSANEARAQEIFEKITGDRPGFPDRITEIYFHSGARLIHLPGKRHIGMHYLNRSLQRELSRQAEAAIIFHDTGLETVSENKWLAHQILGRALELNPEYEDDDQFYVAYRVETVSKDTEILTGGEGFLQRFPKSLMVPRILYKMGEASLNTGKRNEAKGYFKRLAEEFPDTEFGQKARGRLQGL